MDHKINQNVRNANHCITSIFILFIVQEYIRFFAFSYNTQDIHFILIVFKVSKKI